MLTTAAFWANNNASKSAIRSPQGTSVYATNLNVNPSVSIWHASLWCQCKVGARARLNHDISTFQRASAQSSICNLHGKYFQPDVLIDSYLSKRCFNVNMRCDGSINRRSQREDQDLRDTFYASKRCRWVTGLQIWLSKVRIKKKLIKHVHVLFFGSFTFTVNSS